MKSSSAYATNYYFFYLLCFFAGYVVVVNTAPLTTPSPNLGPVLISTQTTSSYIKVNNENWPTSTLDEFTICFWIQNFATSNPFTGIFSYATTNQFNMLLIGLSGNLEILLYISGNSVSTSVFLVNDVWHHVCVEWQSTGGVWSVFKNGTLADDGTGFVNGVTIPRGPTDEVSVILAQEQDSFGGAFDLSQSFVGELDGVSMWDGVLGAASVAELFGSCDLPSLNQSQLLAWNQESFTLFGDAVAQNPSLSPCQDTTATELEASVECTENGITVALAISSMDSETPYAYFDNASCVGSSNGTHIILTTGLNECGTQFKFPSSEEITYYNNVRYVDAVESSGSTISRSDEIKVSVECTYLRDKILSVGSFSAHFGVLQAFVKGIGDIAFSMNLYKASDFAEPYAADDFPVEVEVGEPLYVEVSAHSSSPDLALLIAGCHASDSDNPADQSSNYYPLIESGCPFEDSTFEYIASDSAFSKRFTFEAFIFLDQTDEIFLHCAVVLCSPGDGVSCEMECLEQPQKRHLSQTERNVITLGPLNRAALEKGTN